MKTAKYNLSIQSGETVNRQFKFLMGNGIPFDLTPYSASSYVKVDSDDATTSSAFIPIKTDAVNGVLTLFMSASASTLLTGSCYYYDIRLVSATETIYPLEGKLLVSPSITK